ncbi:MAG TPA: cell envelope integrity protein TolA [Syntrophorhabdales bacterium]|nr:cell envelope integrity protein TolA [Syntrophorhabdales bacterium]
MREENWHKMLMISAALHLVVLAALSFPVKKAFRKFDASKSYYSVNLVGDIGPGLGSAGEEKGKAIPSQKPEIAKPQQTAQKKTRPTPTREKDVRSLAPKKSEKEKPQNTAKDDLKNVEDRIREMKRRTGNTSVASAKGTPGTSEFSGSGGAGGRLIDPALARYLVGVREKIETSWHIPFISSQQKNLEVNATIKIRRDGRIVDITIDKRSGNRVYDESVVRVLRMVDPLPPLPSSVTDDPLEVELTLRPEGVS